MRKILLQLFSHHTLALLRWDLHFVWVRATNFIFLREQLLRRRIDNLTRPLYLNFGSGPRRLRDAKWINVDGYEDTNVDYIMDFNRRFPFSDGVFEGIFCEHVFEHFSLESGQALLLECFRVLQPGGCLRIIVPDGEKIMRSYFDNPAELLAHRLGDTACAMEAVNSYFRQRYEHPIAYDAELLGQQFISAGFIDVSKVSFKHGKLSSAIILDDEKYAWESLYMEAIKP